VAGHPAPELGTWSIAALPGSRRIVWVGPPLSASGASLGSEVLKPDRLQGSGGNGPIDGGVKARL
jgi:hypothetical protein